MRANPTVTIILFITLGSDAASGQGYLHSPPFLASSEGHDLVPFFGLRPSMRYQMVDGEVRGNRVSLKEVALRLNETTGQSPWIASGRTWSSFVIRIADGDRASFSTDFSKNMLSTPTVVFRSSVTWPRVDVPLTTRPAPWGGATGAYRFPFTSVWFYGGQSDVVTDWTFGGGTLAGSVAWSSTTPFLYHFDGFGSPSSVAGSSARRIPSVRLDNNSPGVTTRCNDSGYWTLPQGSYILGDGLAYGSQPSNPALANQLVVRSYSYLTAKSATVIHGWGFISDDRGIDVGTGCNRFHIRGPMVITSATANAGGLAQTPDAVTPWRPAYADGLVTMQAAWTDSVTSGIGLTQALELQLPGHAPPSRPILRSCIRETDLASVKGPFSSGNDNPALRYGY